MNERFKPIDVGTILDTRTGLEWQAEAAADSMTQDEATRYAESLGDGWRLPTIKELLSLVDYSKASPATTFPDHPSEWFWSSSVLAYNTGYAWLVFFHNGYVHSSDKNNTYHVRCVRRGPRTGHFDSSAEARARIAELEAEVERLTSERDEAQVKADRSKKARQTASSASAEEKERWRRERIDAGRYEAQAHHIREAECPRWRMKKEKRS